MIANPAASLNERRPIHPPHPYTYTSPADVRAVCTTADRRTAQFRVTYASPCNDGQSTTVFMTVQTRPTNCKRDYDPKLAKW